MTQIAEELSDGPRLKEVAELRAQVVSLKKELELEGEQKRECARNAQQLLAASKAESEEMVAYYKRAAMDALGNQAITEKKLESSERMREYQLSALNLKLRTVQQENCRIHARREKKYQPGFAKAKGWRIRFGMLRHFIKYRSLDWSPIFGLAGDHIYGRF